MPPLATDDLSAGCLARLGLSWQPFKDAPRPGFVYTDAILQMPVSIALDYLQNRDLVLLFTGERGIGKTTQLELLQARGAGLIDFLPLLGDADLKLATIETRLQRHWPRLDSAGVAGSPVLLIDDADRLAPGVLKGLLRLKLDLARNGLSLGLLLAAEPAIATVLSDLEAENPDAARSYCVQLRPYTPAQIQGYLEHRLRQAGLHRELPFDDATIRQIHRESAGLPRAINENARRHLEATAAHRA